MNGKIIKELLSVLNYYVIGGLTMGIMIAAVVANSGIVLVRADYGLPIPARVLTAALMILIGFQTAILAFLVLLPAEVKIIQRRQRREVMRRTLGRRK